MPKPTYEDPVIRWHQLMLVRPTLVDCFLRVTAHGPSGTAMVSVRSTHGEPGTLVMQELFTSVPIKAVQVLAEELLRQLLAHELEELSPF